MCHIYISGPHKQTHLISSSILILCIIIVFPLLTETYIHLSRSKIGVDATTTQLKTVVFNTLVAVRPLPCSKRKRLRSSCCL